MNSVVEIIKLIKIRPAMYLSRNYISCLKAFIDGWYLRDHNSIVDADVMGGFQDWIGKKYKITSSHSWCDIILFYSQDESTALNKFFDEFEEWLQLISTQ
jgi:hypothetical protein